MQREILESEPTAELHVYAVWVPFSGGTSEAADVSRRVLPDSRVTHFWDGDAVTSDWFAENVDHSPFPAWDVFYLFDPNASWTDVPEPIVSSGATIIGQSSALQVAITPLLAR
ncbi:MAG: hypothetical protein ACRDG2_10335 [Actinomycetota bacterium]